MGEIIIKKDKKDPKLKIPNANLDYNLINDGDKLKVEIKSQNGKLNLKCYLGVMSGKQMRITKYGIAEIDKHYKLYPEDEISCIYEKKDFQKDFIDYYRLFKALAKKHRDLGFGKSPRLAEGFTENLCRYLFKLYKIKGRDYDAIDNTGNNVEIKATTSEKGTVTINSDVEFDYLLWMHFDIDNDNLSIYKMPYSYFKEKFKLTYGRITIDLNSFKNKKTSKSVYKIDNKNIHKI